MTFIFYLYDLKLSTKHQGFFPNKTQEKQPQNLRNPKHRRMEGQGDPIMVSDFLGGFIAHSTMDSFSVDLCTTSGTGIAGVQ